MKIRFIILCICIAGMDLQLLGQVNDDFSDAEFYNDPTWVGDDSLFQVNLNLELQSKGRTGTSNEVALLTSCQSFSTTVWSFYLRFAFNPSTQNLCRIVLMSDVPNPKGAFNGYFLQFGGSVGSTDSICLYKQVGVTRTRLLSGRPSTVGKTNNTLNVQVRCDSLGTWLILSDTSCTGNFVSEGSASSKPSLTQFYSGIWFKYTSSNVAGCYLDNFSVTPFVPDTTPPKLLSLDWEASGKVTLTYDEPIDDAQPNLIQKFTLDSLKANPTSVSFLKPSQLLLSFPFVFNNRTKHQLMISKISDRNGNTAKDTTAGFSVFTPELNDIVVSEFMADPDPPVGLPNVEYIELFNRSGFRLNLKNLMLSDASSTTTIPNFSMDSAEFVILSSLSSQPLLAAFGKCIGVNSFPSLNNSGDSILLKSQKGTVLFQLAYQLSDYHDPSKQNGGYSIELKTPFSLCDQNKAWSASCSLSGGTPGKQNSQWSLLPDTVAPQLLSVFARSQYELLLAFTEPILLNQVQLNFTPDPGPFQLGQINDTIYVLFNDSVRSNTVYQLNVLHVSDCSGNAQTQSDTFSYIPCQPALQNDIVINEILHTPVANSSLPNHEFVEIFNRSEKWINLKNMRLKNGPYTNILPEFRLEPKGYAILCDIADTSSFSSFGKVVPIKSMYSLYASDEISLRDPNGFLIHSISYTTDWFHDKLKQSLGGFSIEMIDPDNPCGDGMNWSASVAPLKGTPGKRNSVLGSNPDTSPPDFVRLYPGAGGLEVYFSEPIDSLSTVMSNALRFDPLVSISNQAYLSENGSSLLLQLNSLLKGTTYSLQLNSIKDCAGNIVKDFSAKFALPEPVDSGKLVMNEVLFNPFPNGVDFIELKNLGDSFIDLRPYWLANLNDLGQPENLVALAPGGWLLAPQSYLAITSNPSIVQSQYRCGDARLFLTCNLPSMNNDKGSIVLIDTTGRFWDMLTYTEKMHAPWLVSSEGVSLERLDPFRSSAIQDNWCSASTSEGFATPGRPNSQNSKVQSQNDWLTLSSISFSPDGDGYNDLLEINYVLSKPESLLNLQVFDDSGNLVHMLISNLLCGSMGKVCWNGTNAQNKLVGNGIYLIRAEAFSKDGNHLTKVAPCVLATKVNKN